MLKIIRQARLYAEGPKEFSTVAEERLQAYIAGYKQANDDAVEMCEKILAPLTKVPYTIVQIVKGLPHQDLPEEPAKPPGACL